MTSPPPDKGESRGDAEQIIQRARISPLPTPPVLPLSEKGRSNGTRRVRVGGLIGLFLKQLLKGDFHEATQFSPAARYRLPVTSRVLAVEIGGYAPTSALTMLLALISPSRLPRWRRSC